MQKSTKTTKNKQKSRNTALKGATGGKASSTSSKSKNAPKTPLKKSGEVKFKKKNAQNDKIEKINYWAPQNVETWEDAKKVWAGRNRTFNQYNKTHKNKLSFSEFAEMQINKAREYGDKEKTKAKK